MDKGSFRILIDRIKEKTDIVRVIGTRISLNRQLKAPCPFHNEQTPSFSVNQKSQYFHCFGCGKSGDVIAFLEVFENKTFWEAATDLSREAGMTLPNLSPEDRLRIEQEQIIGDILTETGRFYHNSLTPEAKDYLIRERNISHEILAQHLVGFAKGELTDHLLNKCKFPEESCLEAGVLKKTKSDSIKDYFHDRIILPNLKRGRVVHLTGRSLLGQEPKYLHMPGEISYLYNEDDLSGESVIVTEGVLDCLSLVQAGYHAVATLGTANLKPEYLDKLSRCSTVYICLDGDEAGRIGSLRIASAVGDKARIMQLPEGCDPNEYFKRHQNSDFDRIIASANDLVRYELELIPPDIHKADLPSNLEGVLQRLAGMEKVRSEAYLNHEIKTRFNLTNEDTRAYRELINKYRTSQNKLPEVHISTTDNKPDLTANFDGLVDLVEDECKPAFVVKEGENLSILHKIEKDGQTYVPPPIDKIPWLLPNGRRVLEQFELQRALPRAVADRALYDDLLAHHMRISELPGEAYYDLIVAWDLHTYLLENLQYSPMVCLFAVPERGKSRTGKGMIHVAYRGIQVESLRDAYLVRFANNFGGSIFFDVRDVWRKAEKNQSDDILLHRFEKGAKVPRVLYPERGAFQDTVFYQVFGPTVIATNETVHRILETRAVQINMPETSKRFENDVTQEHSLPLKERLLAFRAGYLGNILRDISKPAAGRLGDILRPIQQIIRLVRPDREESFLKLIKELEADRRIEKVDSLEAQILRTVIGLESEVNRGILPVKTITDTLNHGKSERNQVTYQRIGRRLTAIGFKKATTADGGSAIIWDENKIERMKGAYGLEQMSVMPETSETPDDLAGITDISDDTDVSHREHHHD